MAVLFCYGASTFYHLYCAMGKGSELQKQSIAMHEWFCAEAGNAEKLPCLMHRARSSSDKAEKKALYARMRPDPKDKAVAEERKATMDAMHEAWCARDEARGNALCVNWRASAKRRAEATAKKEAHKEKPNYGAEYVEMHTAYCDDKPENAETAPCIMMKHAWFPLCAALPL